ncbi:uncharacterized protein [Euphorbia lathyris]|uniref:uncharacterized protein n=1 Tax=Euphorbia lathyris TaxID=212925 RepID=UPI003313E415
MTMEEASGPAGPKVLRMLYFVGAGFICTIAINKWKEFEKKSIQKQHQESQLSPNLLSHSSSTPNPIQRPSK